MYGYYSILAQPYKTDYALKHVYLGVSYSNKQIEQSLQRYEGWIRYEKYDHNKIAKLAAEKISTGKIVGWFQGGSEFGSRALGHRSILADPRLKEMKDIVNSRVKFRESFRPFAPSVLKEYAAEYFDMQSDDSPFMLLVFDLKEEKREVIPAVTHIDGTARIQTVTQTANDHYYNLIVNFRQITGVPVVLNTSFNIKGEPIVETSKDALKCFLGTQIDVVFIENYFVTKI